MTPPPGRGSRFSGWLDLFRAGAAFAVLLGHGRALFIRSAAAADAVPPAVRVGYFLSGFGHQAVMVFFVLSGFLVGGAVARACRDGRWSWRGYATQRLTRLYVVLLPALLLTLGWDLAEQSQSAGRTPNADTGVANITSEGIRANTSPPILAGNVAFLQTIAVPPLGSNTPLWSLANEFWYYVLFPLIWLGLTGPGGWGRRGLLLAAACGILAAVGGQIAAYFVVWLLGAGCYLLPGWRRLRGRVARGAATGAAALALAAGLLASRTGRVPDAFAADLIVGAACAALVYVRKHDAAPAHPVMRRVWATAADFSYTLYLAHLPPLIFLRACLTYEQPWDAGAWSWARLFGLLGGIALYAYVLSLVTEARTEQVRRWVTRRVAHGRPAPQSESPGAP